MWFHKRPLPVINSNPFYPFPRKPIRQFNLAFFPLPPSTFSYSQHNHRRGEHIQLAPCRDGQVKTLGGVAGTSKAIDLRGVEGPRGEQGESSVIHEFGGSSLTQKQSCRVDLFIRNTNGASLSISLSVDAEKNASPNLD